MGETIRNASRISEELGDGRSVERGGFAQDVDLEDEINARLLREGRIIVVPTEEEPEDRRALERKAKALKIESYRDLNDDDLRAQIAEKEEAAQ